MPNRGADESEVSLLEEGLDGHQYVVTLVGD